ncbi:uncharacterized protein LOC143521674 isoform X3 [Brachyhypopomus gauderio]|uniref:uncharacterized protein LOC143521674 isoform X3 n=1 Tax=Brachyhypopomus gauderio TaxID=698409 RepID=UPI004041FED7
MSIHWLVCRVQTQHGRGETKVKLSSPTDTSTPFGGKKIETPSSAPTCMTARSDQSMDLPVQSMDLPIMFRNGVTQDRLSSPAPSCTSMKSDHSADRPITFNRETAVMSVTKDRLSSPAPSCTSMKSDHSADRPITFNRETAVRSVTQDRLSSPAPSCTSMKSDHSADRPITFNRETAVRSVTKDRLSSPAPSCTSMKSDHSADRPITFNRETAVRSVTKDRLSSPAPSCTSMKSDHSADRPITFNRETAVRRLKRETSPSPCQSEAFMAAPNTLRDETYSPDINELSASLLTEDHFRCSVCTDVLKEPVSIPCGHSYCKTCIQTYWNNPTQAGSYSCPQCRKIFHTRPALNTNSALAKVVEKLQQAGFSPVLPAHCYAGPGDVVCDFCTGRKLRAVKSCLTCTASYCETHVRQHYTVTALQRHRLVEVTGDLEKTHRLVEVTGDLEKTLCKLHHRVLEVFCRTDQTFICFMCMMEEHKEHDTVVSKNEPSTVEINTSVKEHQFNLLEENKMETEMKHLLKEIEEMRTTVERADTELTYLAKLVYRGLEQESSGFVEVSALGRNLDLGMLYDRHTDSISSDVFLWDEVTLSSMRRSFPRPHTDVRILEGDSLRERLRALDLTPPLRASVVAGLVEVSGAAAFLNHPTQSQLQDRVTLHYRTSTKLDMLSHTLLQSAAPLSPTNQNTATHVVVAVLYGAQAFFVFDNDSENSEGNTELQSTITKMITCSSTTELLSSLSESEQSSCLLYDCSIYIDGEHVKNPVNFDTALNLFNSFQKLLGPQGQSAVPLKVWLYPLKNLDQKSPCVNRDISENSLFNSVAVLEHFERTVRTAQDMMSSYSNFSVITWFSALSEDLCLFSSLLQQYRSVFRRALASCIKIIRERGQEGEESLKNLLRTNDQSPFSSQNIQQWLQNKEAEVKALNECRNNNITIVKSQKEMKHVIQDSQTDRVLCFTLTSLESVDPFLSALRQQIDLQTMSKQDTQLQSRLPDTSEKILSDLHAFLTKKETEKNVQQIKFITASIPEPHSQGSSIRLYQSGCLISPNVKLAVEPELPEIITVKQTSVTLKLQRGRKRVEYRALSCRGVNTNDPKWTENVTCSTEDECDIMDLTPETLYQLRYAVLDSNSMSEYSRIIEFQTLRRSRPGQPTVVKQTQKSLTVSWRKADGDAPVLHYMVEYMEAGLEDWQSILTEGPECECTITPPYSTCYRVRVSAVYGEGDTSRPSEEMEIPVDKWCINLSERKASLFLEVLKLHTVKKPVELRGWSDEESEVRSFLQCLPYISQLSFGLTVSSDIIIKFLVHLLHEATDCEKERGEKTLELLSSVCRHETFPYKTNTEQRVFLMNLCLHAALHQINTVKTTTDTLIWPLLKTPEKHTTFPVDEDDDWTNDQCDFLLDLYSHVKDYETQTGRSVLPALQPVYQSAPVVWYIDLSERKTSLFLEVLKLHTVKKPVELRGWSDEESEVRSFLQCLPYISQLRVSSCIGTTNSVRIILHLFSTVAECEGSTEETLDLLTSMCTYSSFPYGDANRKQSDFLLDLYSHVRDYENQRDRSVLPTLQPIYQSAPAVWNIDLSKRKTSLFLEVLKLQRVKKPVELWDWSDEESEVRSFLQCLPYISQLSFVHYQRKPWYRWSKRMKTFLLDLCLQAALSQRETVHTTVEDLISQCFGTPGEKSDFLLDLYSHLKNCENQRDRSVLPALQQVYQSAPAVWNIDLSKRKTSLFLEVLKLQTVKKPVELRGWSNEESEVKSFLQCLPYISQLSFVQHQRKTWNRWSKRMKTFLLDLCLQAALSQRETVHTSVEELISQCFGTPGEKSDFLLDLYSHLKNCENQRDRSVLPAFQQVYQSAPAVWNIDLSKRKTSLFLEVLKLQTVKKPVVLRGWSNEESEVRSFLQCLPYISQFSFVQHQRKTWNQWSKRMKTFLLDLCLQAALSQRETVHTSVEELISQCFGTPGEKSDFLLHLYSRRKDYENQRDRSAPAVWNIDLSKRKTFLFLEVLKLQIVKKPVELRDWSDGKCEMRTFLQCLPYTSQLSRLPYPLREKKMRGRGTQNCSCSIMGTRTRGKKSTFIHTEGLETISLLPHYSAQAAELTIPYQLKVKDKAPTDLTTTIIKCAAHTRTGDTVAKGNAFTDSTAQNTVLQAPNTQMMLTDHSNREDTPLTTRAIQTQATMKDKQRWAKGGVQNNEGSLDTHTETGQSCQRCQRIHCTSSSRETGC